MFEDHYLLVGMKKDLDEEEDELLDLNIEEELKNNKEDRNINKDAKLMAKESLKDIVPNKDILTQIEEGDKDIDELLRDATFKGKANSLGYNKRREQKVLLKKALKELKNKF